MRILNQTFASPRFLVPPKFHNVSTYQLLVA